MTLTDVSPQEAEGVRAQIADKQAELLAVFPADFDAQVAAYAPGAAKRPTSSCTTIPPTRTAARRTRCLPRCWTAMRARSSTNSM